MRTRRQAFTTIELLLAATITLALAAVMLTVTISMLNVWQRTQDSFTSGSQATLVLDYLERDLQSALFRPNNQTWLAIDVNYAPSTHGWLTSGPIKPATMDCLSARDGRPLIAESKFGRTGAWLRFFTSDSRSTTDATLPLVVGYQVVRRSLNSTTPVDPANIRYSLFRSVIDGGVTFSNGYEVGSYNNMLGQPALVDVLATNVIDFGVWLYTRDGSGQLTRIYPTSSTDDAHAANSAASAPVVADVMVRILSEEGASLIAAIEQGLFQPPASLSADSWWWQVATAHSHVFVRRIEMPGRGP